MDPKKAQQDLKQGKIWPVYYCHGEEPFKINAFIDRLKEIHLKDMQGASVERFDGTDHNADEVLNALQSLSLFAGICADQKKLVIVKNADKLKNIEIITDQFTKLSSFFNVWDQNILIFVSQTLDQRKKINQWFKKNGFSLEFKKAKDDEMKIWIDYLCKKSNIKCSPQAAELLAISCDGSLYKLASELEKASLYEGRVSEVPISAETVSKISTQNITHEMFNLIDAIVLNKKTRALVLTEKLILASEDAIGFVGFMVWALKNQQARSWKIQMKRKVLNKLLKLDQKLKSSPIEAKTLVENFILEII